jgi:hypothetical protein
VAKKSRVAARNAKADRGPNEHVAEVVEMGLLGVEEAALRFCTRARFVHGLDALKGHCQADGVTFTTVPELVILPFPDELGSQCAERVWIRGAERRARRNNCGLSSSAGGDGLSPPR